MMKYLIVSDIHGSLPALEQVLAFYREQQCGMLCILGDILNYGPRNGIPQGLDPKGIAEHTSVMIDGSHETFEENVALTKKVVEVANAYGVPVEAELGKVGGKEDDLEAEADHNTDPEEAKEFVERTGVSSLAIAIGTAHGFYAGTPVLDKERVSDCKKVVSVPLVLHGASGLSEEDVVECVQRGMCKVNFATELRVAYTDAEKQLLKENPETFDPKKLGIAAMKAVKEQTILRMKMCGCTGKVQ